jgi:hypothetical protein
MEEFFVQCTKSFKHSKNGNLEQINMGKKEPSWSPQHTPIHIQCYDKENKLIKELKHEEDVDTYKEVLNLSLELSNIISNKGTYVKFHYDRWIIPISYETVDTFFPFYYYGKEQSENVDMIYSQQKITYMVRKNVTVPYRRFVMNNVEFEMVVLNTKNGKVVFVTPNIQNEKLFFESIDSIYNKKFLKEQIKKTTEKEYNYLKIPKFGSVFTHDDNVSILYFNHIGIDKVCYKSKALDLNVILEGGFDLNRPFVCIYIENDTFQYSIIPFPHNPYKSKKQRAYFWWRASTAKGKKKEIWKKRAKKWGSHTKKKILPVRKKKKKKKKGKNNYRSQSEHDYYWMSIGYIYETITSNDSIGKKEKQDGMKKIKNIRKLIKMKNQETEKELGEEWFNRLQLEFDYTIPIKYTKIKENGSKKKIIYPKWIINMEKNINKENITDIDIEELNKLVIDFTYPDWFIEIESPIAQMNKQKINPWRSKDQRNLMLILAGKKTKLNRNEGKKTRKWIKKKDGKTKSKHGKNWLKKLPKDLPPYY